jgi:hypothetical protein
MYEMEGALSGLAAPDPPVARLPRRRAPPARARYPREPPVSRPFPRPGVSPRWCPFPTVNVFLHASASVAQEPAGIHFEFFRRPHVPHRTRAVIRTSQRLSTALCTNHPQITWRNSGNTGAYGRVVMIRSSWRRLVRELASWAWCQAVRGPPWRQGGAAWRGCGHVHPLWGRLPPPPPSAASAGGRRAVREVGGPGGGRPGAAGAQVRNAPVNTIALCGETIYHGYMTTWQAQKRAGYMNPISQLEAALIGGVVAV